MDMRVVLIHFHLNTGGVTSVVRQQTEMLMAKGHDVLLVTGEAPPAKWPAHVAVVPGLAYDSPAGKNAVSAPETASAILNAIHRYWPNQRPDIVHVHNPTLAKNNRLQAVLKRLQQAGLILLCQIHDFAEDGRPNVYFDEPYLSDCHYAVVNGRDLQTLRCCGLKEDGVHHLPNAVQPLKAWKICCRYRVYSLSGQGHPQKEYWRGHSASVVCISLNAAGHYPTAQECIGAAQL